MIDYFLAHIEFVAMMKKGTGSAEQTNPKKRRDLVLE
jgi:hypothetical protein